MPVFSKQSSIWEDIHSVFGNVSGTWYEMLSGWVKVNGTWQPVFADEGITVYPFEIANSCIFERAATNYLSYTFSSAATDMTKGAFSVWTKRTQFTLTGAGTSIPFMSALQSVYDEWGIVAGNDYPTFITNGGNQSLYNNSYLLRDPCSWQHHFVKWDTAQADLADRLVWYINGVQVDLSGTIVQSIVPSFFGNNLHYINLRRSSAVYGDQYYADYIGIDGDSTDIDTLAVTDFGEFNYGIWVPKNFTGDYGGNGFRLEFKDSSDLGKDTSGNGHDFTSSGMTTANQSTDSPTNNFPVLNVLQGTLPYVMAEGNLHYTESRTQYSGMEYSGLIMSTGKWYWELEIEVLGYGAVIDIGLVVPSIFNFASAIYDNLNSWNWAVRTGVYQHIWDEDTDIRSDSAIAASEGDTMQVAYDADTGKLWFGLNNSWFDSSTGTTGDPANGTNPTITISNPEGYLPFINLYRTAGYTGSNGKLDFGQNGFTYTPPSGFSAPAFANFTDPATFEPSAGFTPYARAGTGAAADIDIGMQPDFVWIKNRDYANSHWLTDSTRGATKTIFSNDTDVETTQAQGLTSFNSDGHSVGTHAAVNSASYDYIDWCWKKDPAFGFDIVAYTGTGVARTISHSLGVVPELILVKDLSYARTWGVYSAYLTSADYYLQLNVTNAQASDSTVWNGTDPTSSVFSVGTAANTNTNNEDYIAYLFASIPQFSKVGVYTGNGSTSGPFIYCGFRPAFLMMKRFDAANGWSMHDSARNPYNDLNNYILANASSAEAASGQQPVDFVATGFKLRATDALWNANNGTYLYLAFAEQPGKYSNAR